MDVPGSGTKSKLQLLLDSLTHCIRFLTHCATAGMAVKKILTPKICIYTQVHICVKSYKMTKKDIHQTMDNKYLQEENETEKALIFYSINLFILWTF